MSINYTLETKIKFEPMADSKTVDPMEDIKEQHFAGSPSSPEEEEDNSPSSSEEDSPAPEEDPPIPDFKSTPISFPHFELGIIKENESSTFPDLEKKTFHSLLFSDDGTYCIYPSLTPNVSYLCYVKENNYKKDLYKWSIKDLKNGWFEVVFSKSSPPAYYKKEDLNKIIYRKFSRTLEKFEEYRKRRLSEILNSPLHCDPATNCCLLKERFEASPEGTYLLFPQFGDRSQTYVLIFKNSSGRATKKTDAGKPPAPPEDQDLLTVKTVYITEKGFLKIDELLFPYFSSAAFHFKLANPLISTEKSQRDIHEIHSAAAAEASERPLDKEEEIKLINLARKRYEDANACLSPMICLSDRQPIFMPFPIRPDWKKP
jgi:hypothetical protein